MLLHLHIIVSQFSTVCKHEACSYLSPRIIVMLKLVCLKPSTAGELENQNYQLDVIGSTFDACRVKRDGQLNQVDTHRENCLETLETWFGLSWTITCDDQI